MIYSLLIAALLLWKPGSTTFAAVWHERWYLIMYIGCLMAILRINLPIIHRVIISYFPLVAVFSLLFPSISHPLVSKALQQATVDQLMIFMCLLSFVTNGKDIKKILLVASMVVYLAICFSPDPRYYVYLLHNPTMAATFVILASWSNPLLSIVSIFLTHSWTASIALCVALCYRYRKQLWPWGFYVGFISWLLIVSYIGKIPDNGRFATWEQLFTWWKWLGGIQHLFGAGAGSTGIILPLLNISQATGETASVFIWAHNDWLQILVEYGIVGTILSLVSFIWLFKWAKESDRALLLAYSVAMITNFPTHWAITALVGWSLIQRSVSNHVIEEQYELTG